MQAEPSSRRSVRRALSHLSWGILHSPTVLRNAISGFYDARYARSRVEYLKQVTDAIQTRLAATEQAIRAVKPLDQVILTQVTDAIQTSVAATEGAIAALGGQVAHVSARLNELDNQSQDPAIAATGLIARIAELAAQSARLTQQLALVKREVMFQQRQLTRLAVPAAGQLQKAAAAILTQRHDSLYAALEDVFRGSREATIERLTPYVERLNLAGAGQPGKPIVDVDCGRGEWLELLRQAGLSAYGIDTNTIVVERATALGLDARHADLMDHLHGLEDASRSAVTAFHVLALLPFETLVDFIDEALRILIPGGTLILETPNRETIRAGATTFYHQLAHRDPLMPVLLQFIIEHRGFTDVEILKLGPFVQGPVAGTSENVQLPGHVLFHPPEFAIIARRL